MRTFALLGCVGMVVTSIVVACAGDDAKHVRNGDGGGAGRGEGGAAGVGHGGGEANPTQGGAGAGAVTGGAGAVTGGGGAGGAHEPSGEGGTGAPAPGSDGGSGGAITCEREVDQNYACTEVETAWAPVWNSLQARFELDVTSLPFPIASGTLSYFVNNADFQECGTVDVQVNGNLVYAPITITNVKLSPTNARITTFSLIDVCGNHRDFDPRGVPNCNDLRGSGNFENWALTCNTRAAAICPEVCLGE